MCAARAATGRAHGTTLPTSRDRRLLLPINRCDNTLPGNLGGQLLPSRVPRRLARRRPASTTSSGSSPRSSSLSTSPTIQRSREERGAARACGRSQDPTTLSTCIRCSRQRSRAPARRAPRPDLQRGGRQGEEERPGTRPRLGDGLHGQLHEPIQDPSITWLPSGPANENQDFKVTFDWSTTGKCGVPPSGNNSGHCMILQPVEVQIGGSHPGGGIDSNVRAYKLCDPTVWAHVAR